VVGPAGQAPWEHLRRRCGWLLRWWWAPRPPLGPPHRAGVEPARGRGPQPL